MAKKTEKDFWNLINSPTASEIEEKKRRAMEMAQRETAEGIVGEAHYLMDLVNTRVALVRRASNRKRIESPKGMFARVCPVCGKKLFYLRTYFSHRDRHVGCYSWDEFYDSATKLYYCTGCGYEWAKGRDDDGRTISLDAAKDIIRQRSAFEHYHSSFIDLGNYRRCFGDNGAEGVGAPHHFFREQLTPMGIWSNIRLILIFGILIGWTWLGALYFSGGFMAGFKGFWVGVGVILYLAIYLFKRPKTGEEFFIFFGQLSAMITIPIAVFFLGAGALKTGLLCASGIVGFFLFQGAIFVGGNYEVAGRRMGYGYSNRGFRDNDGFP